MAKDLGAESPKISVQVQCGILCQDLSRFPKTLWSPRVFAVRSFENQIKVNIDIFSQFSIKRFSNKI